ncbi:hypothetical protein F5Y07DRAFT_382923 [Xylaria sp. FL0933]|nr:hypothetical protein F5Y07DRAFT_382923 [Xylaria sp. FL0933]
MSDASNHPDPTKGPSSVQTRAKRHAHNNLAKNVRRDNGSLLKSVAHSKILKHSLSEPQRPQTERRLRSDAHTLLYSCQVPLAQYERAISLYRKLQTLRLECPIARLQPQHASATEPGVIWVKYPRNNYWLLKFRIHSLGYRPMPVLTRQDLQHLRRILTRDIERLYDAHVPYKFDISIVPIAISRTLSRRLQRETYKLFINSFDLDVDPEDESIEWAVLKEKTIKSVKAQFAVMEALADCSSKQPKELPVNLDPDAAFDVLEASKPLLLDHLFIIRHVAKYSTRLGDWVAGQTGCFLRMRPARDTPPSPPSVVALAHRDTVAHMLRLMDSLTFTGHVEEHQLLADRVALLAVYTSLLVHQYARVIVCCCSTNILVIENEETPEMYVGRAQFRIVADARRRLGEAMDAYSAMGVQLSDGATHYLRQPPLDFKLPGDGDLKSVGSLVEGLKGPVRDRYRRR